MDHYAGTRDLLRFFNVIGALLCLAAFFPLLILGKLGALQAFLIGAPIAITGLATFAAVRIANAQLDAANHARETAIILRQIQERLDRK